VILATTAPRRPSEEHLELMQAFTSQAGIAIQNAKLYQVSRKEQERIVHNESDMRQKLARDLHDGPTQKLAALVMQIDYINRLLEVNPKEARIELKKAREVAEQAVKEIRTALFTLRPLVLETKGLSAAVQSFGERLRDNEKVAIQVDPGAFGPELDTNVAVTVFAIIEEAIGNARKHAAGAAIFVSLQQKEHTLLAVVQDQGPGFDVEHVQSSYDQRSSLGLQNMHERARLIDGTLTILSAPGQGTRITLACPIPPPQLTGPE
jgi:signal transduction histidine kinase